MHPHSNLHFLFFGYPGSGKGTQSTLMIRDFSLYFICTGKLLREQIHRQSDLGREVQSFMAKGQLVSDDTMLKIIESAFCDMDETGKKGFVMDGFPRTLPQAKALDKLLEKRGDSISKVLFLNVKKPVLLKRMEGRRTCPRCGSIYHLHFMLPKVDGKCDHCPLVDLEHRPDDKKEVILRRLKAYEENTEPLRQYYKEQNKLLDLQVGEKESPEEIHLHLKAKLGL